jgi:hypothetical protein
LRNDSPDAVLDYYNAAIAKQQADYDIKQTEHLTGQKMTRSGSGDATIESVELYINGEPARAVLSGVEATLRICGKTIAAIDELTVGILIRDRLGNDVFGTNTYHHTLSQKNVAQHESFTVDFKFPALNLGIGSFSLTVALHSRDAHVTDNYDWWDRVLVFQVLPGNSATSIGVCDLPLSIHWQTNTIDKQIDGAAKVKLSLESKTTLAEKIRGVTICCTEPLAEMSVGEQYTINVSLQNNSDQLLSSSIPHPFNLSYHWYDVNNGNIVVFDGLRTPLVSPCLPYSDEQGYIVAIKAPDNVGQYRLEIALVQEGVRWHESADASSMQVKVLASYNK